MANPPQQMLDSGGGLPGVTPHFVHKSHSNKIEVVPAKPALAGTADKKKEATGHRVQDHTASYL